MAEIVIIGGGPAGMAAAVRAGSSGARLVLLDDNPGPGGQIWRGADEKLPWFRQLQQSGVRLIPGARVVSANHMEHRLTAETWDGSFKLRYDKLILATGARELFLPFPGWTAPKVFGVGGLQALAKSGLSLNGKNVIVTGTGPFLLAAAAYFRAHGAVVPVIAEQASLKSVIQFGRRLLRFPDKLVQGLRLRAQLRGTRYLTSTWVEEATDGVVSLVTGQRRWQHQYDFLAVGYGFVPNVELAASLGCAVGPEGIAVGELQQTSRVDIYAAGECTGIAGVDLAVIEGQIAGLAASGKIDEAHALTGRLQKQQTFARAMKQAFALRPELRSSVREDTFICRCEDVRFADVRELRSRREMKLYTRCGMGACQGRVCGPILDFLTAPDRDSVRPPVFPARLQTLTTTEEEFIAK